MELKIQEKRAVAEKEKRMAEEAKSKAAKEKRLAEEARAKKKEFEFRILELQIQYQNRQAPSDESIAVPEPLRGGDSDDGGDSEDENDKVVLERYEYSILLYYLII